MNKGFLLDTSFLVGLADKTDSWHSKAEEFMDYFCEMSYVLYFSSISNSEILYLSLGELYPKLTQINYEFKHSSKAKELAKNFHNRYNSNQEYLEIKRNAINNNHFLKTVFESAKTMCLDDIKLLAQCEVENSISGFVTFDTRLNTEFQEFQKYNLCKKKFISLNKISLIDFKNEFIDPSLFTQ